MKRQDTAPFAPFPFEPQTDITKDRSTTNEDRITMRIKILDIGQCGFDGPAMSQLFQKTLHATVDNAPTADDAVRHLADQKYNLALVNRILAADGSSGIELIQSLMKSGCTTPLMLVSDLPEAQATAIAHGALRGFGKAELENPKTLELIRNAAR
jgi:hypothetical protein